MALSPTSDKVCCPLCNGTGKIKTPSTNNEEQRIVIITTIIKLRREGYTYRDIAAITGLKHPQSVKHLITPKKLKVK